MKFLSLVSVVATLLVLLVGCSADSAISGLPERADEDIAAKGAVIHRVVAGSNDACEAFGGYKPGCDGNFSLVANEYADGTVKGIWRDVWMDGGAPPGTVVEINCLKVEEYEGKPIAAISGTVVNGYAVGSVARAIVRDLGTSSGDPNDQISYALIGGTRTCQGLGDGTDRPWDWFDAGGWLLDIEQGQVTIW